MLSTIAYVPTLLVVEPAVEAVSVYSAFFCVPTLLSSTVFVTVIPETLIFEARFTVS
jgi:hypothetical protein